MDTMQVILDAGLVLNTDGGRLLAGPASLLTDELRDLIRRHKPELLVAVHEVEVRVADLVAAINRCCDARGDSDCNRVGLIAEVDDFDPRQQADLIQHFNGETRRWGESTDDIRPTVPARSQRDDL